MKKKNLTFIAVSLLTSLAFADAPAKSPFLGDLSGFKADKQNKAILVYRSKDQRAAEYSKFIVDPVLIFQSSHSGMPELSKEERQGLATEFKSAAAAAFKGKYEIVTEPDMGVLRLRFAIRDLKPGRYSMNARGTKIVDRESDIDSASFEMEAIDALTGERVIALFHRFGKESVSGATKQVTRSRVKDLFSDWVNYLVGRLDTAKIPK